VPTPVAAVCEPPRILVLVIKFLRTASTRRLLGGALGFVLAGIVATAVAMAAVGGGAVPPAASLASALHIAAEGKSIDGISANITFTNNLFAGSSVETVDPLLTGASGRLWASGGDLRLELQSDNGDAQLVVNGRSFWISDPTSQTVYEGTLPARRSVVGAGTNPTAPMSTYATPTVAQIQHRLDRLSRDADVSTATATDIGGEPAYDVEVTPKDNSSLIGAVRVGFDADHGIPLDLAVFPAGGSAPALELAASNVSYGPVASSVFDISPPAGSRVVQVAMPAPDTYSSTRTASGDVKVVGEGLGGVLVVKQPAASGGWGAAAGTGSGHTGPLPVRNVSIDGASGQELPTSLGAVLQFTRDGVSYLLAGSVTPSTIASVAASLPR
jgi:outer membrane lipoprotein-sorting protein